jgi:hypothetical protein
MYKTEDCIIKLPLKCPIKTYILYAFAARTRSDTFLGRREKRNFLRWTMKGGKL